MQSEISNLEKSFEEIKLKYEKEKVAENLKNTIKINMLEADQKALVKTNGFLVQNMLELELKQGMTAKNKPDETQEKIISDLKLQIDQKD